MNILKQDRPFSWNNINSTRLFVVFMGTLAGLTGMIHGLYETFQGNTPTGGYVIASFGVFTLIHNYLITGIAAIFIGLLLTIWGLGLTSCLNLVHITNLLTRH